MSFVSNFIDCLEVVFYGGVWIGGIVIVVTIFMIFFDREFDGREFGIFGDYVHRLIKKVLRK
jgi:hypothetical protein